MFEGRKALVVGGASGIGAAVARRFAVEGASIVLADDDRAKGEAVVADMLADGADAEFAHVDVTDAAACAALVDALTRNAGHVDFAVNSAGIVGARRPLHELSPQQWRDVQSVNVDGVFNCMRAELAHMVPRRSGVVVNVASMFSFAARPGLSAYVTSKHAVLGLTKSAALDCAAFGVRVNCVAPGVIETPLVRGHYGNAVPSHLAAEHPVGRLGRPEEVASLIMWLCSDDASFVTGSSYSIDGGFTAG